MNLRTEARPQQRSANAVVVSSAALAAAVVLRHLGTKPLWRDEAISVSVAARPVARILPVLTHHDANAGLYYLLLHGWLRFGAGATWARGFSALSVVAAAGLAAWGGTRWRGWPFGAVCGLLMAVNPFLLYYGQEARPYALAALLAVASTVALFWRGERPAPRAYIVLTVALIYADLFAVLFVAAMAAAVVLVRWSRGDPVPPVLIRAWAMVAAATAPLDLVMVVGQRNQISWLARPRLFDLEFTVTRMTAGWIGFWLVAVLGVVAVAGTWRRRTDSEIVVALAAAFVLPSPVLYVVAQVVPSFIDRYLICSAVAMVGMVAVGLDELRRRAGPALPLAALAVLVLLGGQRAVKLEAQPLKIDNAPGAVAFISSHAAAGDAVAYAGGGMRTVIETAVPASIPWPSDVARAPGGETFRQHDLYAREVPAAELAARLGPVQRLWMVTDSKDHRYPRGGQWAQIRPLVTGQFTVGLRESFDAIDLTLYVRRAG